MTETIQIRTATRHDRAVLGRLWQELMEFHYRLDPDIFGLAENALSCWLEWIAQAMEDDNRIVLVAEAEGTLLGYIHGTVDERPPVYEERRHGTICEICVGEDWRRRGVGGKLVGALFEWSRGRGLPEVHIGAAACNPVSSAFWRAMGFRPHMVQMRRQLEVATDVE